MLPYFPLASGVLTGKYRRGSRRSRRQPAGGLGHGGTLTDERFDVVEALQSYAAERGITLLDVAIGALAAQPAVGSVIAGATTAEQVKANVAAAEWIPTLDDLTALDKIVPSKRPQY